MEGVVVLAVKVLAEVRLFEDGSQTVPVGAGIRQRKIEEARLSPSLCVRYLSSTYTIRVPRTYYVRCGLQKEQQHERSV